MLKQLVGKDLRGWRLERWYEVRLSGNERGTEETIGGYFAERGLATIAGKGKAWFGGDGTVVEVLVLTKDGVTGYLVSGEEVSLNKSLKDKAIADAKKKLTPEERGLLGV